MNAIMSIKPIYAEAIFLGTKKFEFRKTSFKEVLNRVYVYATKPVGEVVGYFDAGLTFFLPVEDAWEICRADAGISRDEFSAYFAGRSRATAIEIKTYQRFPVPKTLADFGLKRPPQSFQYVGEF